MALMVAWKWTLLDWENTKVLLHRSECPLLLASLLSTSFSLFLENHSYLTAPSSAFLTSALVIINNKGTTSKFFMSNVCADWVSFPHARWNYRLVISEESMSHCSLDWPNAPNTKPGVLFTFIITQLWWDLWESANMHWWWWCLFSLSDKMLAFDFRSISFHKTSELTLVPTSDVYSNLTL